MFFGPMHQLNRNGSKIDFQVLVFKGLKRLNAERAANKESIVDENDPVVYAMKNKTSWRIEGKTFLIICNFAAQLIHMKGLLANKLALWKLANPDTAEGLPDVSVFTDILQDFKLLLVKSTFYHFYSAHVTFDEDEEQNETWDDEDLEKDPESVHSPAHVIKEDRNA